MPRFRHPTGPDVHSLVFAALLLGVGATLVIRGGMEFADAGWDGRVPIRERWGLSLSVAEAWVGGGTALVLGALVLWRAWPARRPERGAGGAMRPEPPVSRRR